MTGDPDPHLTDGESKAGTKTMRDLAMLVDYPSAQGPAWSLRAQ